jgi:hypothetical protein
MIFVVVYGSDLIFICHCHCTSTLRPRRRSELGQRQAGPIGPYPPAPLQHSSDTSDPFALLIYLLIYPSAMVEPEPRKDTSGNDFLSTILTPGSSLNPTFLLVVDGVLALLALTLVSLIVVTGGSVHPIALLLIELALWVSIKW